MINKQSDYQKVVKVIRSCKTSAQNNIAYRMCWNFNDLYKDDLYTLGLFNECDRNLIDIMKGR